VALSPDFPLSRYYLGAVEAHHGNFPAALEALEPAASQAPGFPGILGALAHTYRRIARDPDAERLISELRAAISDERTRINYALGLAVVGEADSAFAILESARWDIPTLIGLRADPLLEDFRRDPRYARTLGRVGLRP
jgi:Flp pilus assembly protein TadD